MSWFRRRQREDDLEREIQAHLDLEAEEARENGEASSEARHAAHRAFGNVTHVKEQTREAWGYTWLERLWQDLRFGARLLLKSPGFTAAAVLTLALGIGSTTAIFSAVHSILLSPLPFPGADRLVLVWSWNPRADLPYFGTSGPDYLDWVERNTGFEELAAIGWQRLSLVGRDETQSVLAHAITPNYFDVFERPPVLGRGFTAVEGASEGARPIILTHTFWNSAFDADPNVIGQAVTMANGVYTIVGVAAPEIEYREDFRPQVFVPLAVREKETNRFRRWLWVVGRLKPDVTRSEALAEMRTLAQQVETENPDTNRNWSVKIFGLQELLTEKVRPPLLLLYVAAAFVLLIACVNMASLLLARSESRRQELAIRCAIGAGRLRIVRQLLTESLLLASAGGILGSAMAFWGVDIMSVIAGQISHGRGAAGSSAVHFAGPVWGFTLVATLAVGILFGVYPAWQASKTSINESLGAGGRTVGAGISRRRIFHLSAVSQIALASILMVGAGLLMRSLLRLQNTSPGLNPAQLLVLEMNPSIATDNQLAAYSRAVIERVQSLPGVLGAGSVSFGPLNGQMAQGFQIEGRTPLEEGEGSAEYRCTSGEYFKTAGIPLRRGRLLERQDEGDPAAAVVDETFVRRYFPNEDPLGHQLRIHGRPHEIVGIVGNVKLARLNEQELMPFMYTPLVGTCPDWTAFVVRTAGDPLGMANAIRHALREIDPTRAILRTETMQRQVEVSIAPERLLTILLAGFTGFALLLSALGVYGVMAFQVGQRTREMAIRMAFGARSGDVLRAVLRRGALLIVLGLSIGLAGSLALCRLLSSLLFEVTPYDPATYVAALAFLAAVALISCWLPARRAANVDPMEALRGD